MIDYKLYKKLHGEKITIAGKIFELEFDENRRCFRLYQKKKTLGTKNVDIEIQAGLEVALDPADYLERVNQPLPRHSYLLLDAITLQNFLRLEKARFTNRSLETTTTMASLVEAEIAETKVLESVKLDKKSAKRRVWISSEDCYKTCIDNGRGMFIETPVGEEINVSAFKSYIDGKTYLRRKSPSTIPLPFSLTREFKLLHPGELEIEKILVAGADDSAVATTSADVPKLAPNLLQVLAIFPLFLLMVKGGISGLKAESQETIEALTKIKEEIDKCQKIIEEFLKSETFEKDKALECFKAIGELKELLDELPKAKIEAFSSSILGYPGIVTMFTAIASYQLQAILNLAPDVEKLNTGLSGISTSGYDPSKDVGALAIGGKGLLLGGEAIMILFVIAKVATQVGEYTKRRKEIAEVKESEQLSQMAKEIITSIEQDKQFYDLVKIIGNSTLIVGQIISLSPVLYAGMAISIAGVATAVSAEIIKEKRHGFDKKSTAVEEEISNHYLKQLVDLVLENVKSGATEIDENFRASYSKILRNQAFVSELFFHLTSTNLVVQKILKEGSEEGDFKKAAEDAKDHYKHARGSHQEHLYKLVENIAAADGSATLKDAMSKGKTMGDIAYNILREKLIMKLRINEKDAPWLRELGEKLSEYEATLNPNLMAEITIIEGLPDPIVAALNKAYGKYISEITTDIDTGEVTNKISYRNKALYEEIIYAIQKGFLTHCLNEADVATILAGIEGKTEEEREDELKQLFIDSEAKSVFTIALAQELYDAENNSFRFRSAKKNKHYEVDTPGLVGDKPITIVGEIIKSGTKLLTKTHKKNVYQINLDEFCELSEKAIEKAFAAQKYFERSQTLRAVSAMKSASITNKTTTESLFGKMVEKEPSHDPHSETAVHLLAHESGHESTV